MGENFNTWGGYQDMNPWGGYRYQDMNPWGGYQDMNPWGGYQDMNPCQWDLWSEVNDINNMATHLPSKNIVPADQTNIYIKINYKLILEILRWRMTVSLFILTYFTV
jgi:hypothetical protein